MSHRSFISLKCLAVLLFLAVSFTPFVSFAAPSQADAIWQPIEETALVPLGANIHPAVRSQEDLGAVDPGAPADRILLLLKRTPAQEADFQRLLAELHDKSSPHYHQWLTPAQYGQRFGASPRDLQTLTTWLRGHGFEVKPAGPARTTLEFSGSVGQLQQTFHTELHRFSAAGQEHVANTSAPLIPQALAPIIGGVAGLNSFFPAQEHSAAVRAAYDRASHQARPQSTATQSMTAEATTAESTTVAGGNLLYVGPADAATIYDSPNSFNAGFQGSQSYTGRGVTIAVVSDANIHAADVDAYRSFFGLPEMTTKVVVDGNDPGVDAFTTGHTQQALLNIEVASALAPNAQLMLYTARDTATVTGLYLATARALNDNLADIVQFGFSSCEAELAADGNGAAQLFWSQAAMQGVAVVVGSGDAGPAACDAPAGSTSAQYGEAVNGYASTPYNIAVGGTDFDTLPAKFSQYVGGAGTALGYIPEFPWNDSVALNGNGALDANTPFRNSAGGTDIFAGGGGASSCEDGAVSGTACVSPSNGKSHGYGKPNWQAAPTTLNIPQDGVRDVPDVALLAGTGHYGATWAVCGNDYDESGNPVSDCAAGSGAEANIQGFGGTSASASAFAGMLAMVEESQSARLGEANFVLYQLASQPALYSAIFHDIQSGNNSVVCTAGTPDCGTNGFLTGYNAGAGYDFTSGLGSVDASALIANWKQAVFAPSTTVMTVNGGTGPLTITHGTQPNFTVTVTAADGTPTGRAGVYGDSDQTSGTYGDDVGFAGPLVNGVLSESGPPPGGTANYYARYQGDLKYAPSVSAPVEITVLKENSTVHLALYSRDATGTHPVTTANPSFPFGTYLAIDATPQGLSKQGIATGTVTFSDNLTALTTRTNNLNDYGFAEVPQYSWSGGPHSITASYGGDNSFNPSATAAATTFTISQVPTAMTLSIAPAALTGGTAVVSGVVTPVTASAGVAPSGTVTVTDTTNGKPLGTATLVGGTDPATGGSRATFSLTIDAGGLILGANSLSAAYPGDANYSGSAATTTVTLMAKIATAVTLSATPASLISGVTTLNGVVTPSSSAMAKTPTGTITVTDSTSGAVLGTAPLASGTGLTAVFTLQINATALVPGANTLTAVYPGDVNYVTSSGTTVVTLLPHIATSNSLKASPASLSGGTTLLSGTILASSSGASSSGAFAPSGPVVLTDTSNGAALGSAMLVAGTSGSTYSLTVEATSLALGANAISAVYGGDSEYAGSSATTSVTLNPAPPIVAGFTVSATGVTITQPGETSGNTSTISVTPSDGFTGVVNLTTSLTTIPPQALGPPTLMLSAPSVTVSGSGAATATATIATTALRYAMEQSPLGGQRPAGSRWYSVGGMALACVLLFGVPARRRGWRAMLALLLFASIGLSLGCGVKLNPIQTQQTTAGTYIFTITGTDQATGKIVESGKLTVIVR